jgi:hypothetical protein
MSDEQKPTAEEQDVEAHRRRAANEEAPAEAQDEADDVEGHVFKM